MENNNGKGIFYGVIGVATLVVAIIGATFAFFAANTSGTENAVAGNSVNLEGTLNFEEVADAATPRVNLVPVSEADMKASFAQSGEATSSTGKCKGVASTGGDQVYDLCVPYTFTVSNTASVAQTVYLTMDVNLNGFTNDSLKYCMYEGAALNGEAVVECGTAVPAVSKDNALTSVNLEPTTGSQQYTIVVYIENTSENQNDDAGNKQFAATIKGSTAGNGVQFYGTIAGA